MPLNRRSFLQNGAALAAPITALGGIMHTATAQTALPFSDTADAPVRPGAPVLLVRDLAGLVRYYQDTIGLHVIDQDTSEAQLGAGGRVLLTLRARNGVEIEPQGFAGLYHTAFLLPDRPALGSWLLRAINAKVEFVGAADHLVSEALYLQDPEGNGIEIYADRPRDQWEWDGDMVKMASNSPDIRDIVMAGGGVASETAQVPDTTTVGHIHLRVGGIPEAEAFYNGLMNFDVTARLQGATFYSTGQYHHHIATNTWESRGAPKRSGSVTGLAAFDLLAKDQAAYDTVAEKMLNMGGKLAGSAVSLADPWGNLVQLRRA